MIGVICGAPLIEIRHERLAGRTIETAYEGLSDKLKALGEVARSKKAQSRLVGPIENYGNRLEYSVTKLMIKFNLIIVCQLVAKIRDKVIRQQLCIWLAAHMNLKPQAIIDLGRWTGGPNNPRIIEFRVGGSQAIKSRNRRMVKMIAAAAGATEFGLNWLNCLNLHLENFKIFIVHMWQIQLLFLCFVNSR